MENDLLNWSRAKHGGFEDKEEEKDEETWECKNNESIKKTRHFQVNDPI